VGLETVRGETRVARRITVNRDDRQEHDEDTMRKGVVALIHILRLELQGSATQIQALTSHPSWSVNVDRPASERQPELGVAFPWPGIRMLDCPPLWMQETLLQMSSKQEPNDRPMYLRRRDDALRDKPPLAL
jgi:hypothetical protein